jgi:hypothetical protein
VRKKLVEVGERRDLRGDDDGERRGWEERDSENDLKVASKTHD